MRETTQSTDRDLIVLDKATGDERVVYRSGVGLGWCSWSPEGNHIYGFDLAMGANHRFRVDLRGVFERLTSGRAADYYWAPAVSPDGKWLAFTYGATIDGGWGDNGDIHLRRLGDEGGWPWPMGRAMRVRRAFFLRLGAQEALALLHELAERGELDEAAANGLGYGLLSKRPTDALAVFRLNAESHSNSWNAYDSLGEALLAVGDRAGASSSLAAPEPRLPPRCRIESGQRQRHEHPASTRASLRVGLV